MFKLKTQNLKLDFPLSLRDLYPERWRVRPALSTVEGVRVGRLRFPHLPIHLFTGLIFFALLIAALPAWAAPGDLDTAFGTGGKVTTAIGSSIDHAYALSIQSDGKIVAAGYSNNGSTNYDFALVRYNTDGTLDTTFGTGGKVTTNIGSGYDDIAYALGIQSDGKIVAAGHSSGANYNYDFALVRYNADGTLDTSFGTGGKVTTDIGSSSNDFAYALGIQSDGKIVVAGGYYNGGKNDFALVRYNADGTLDTTFGTGGKIITAIGSVGDFATALVIQSDGRIVVAGYSNSNTGSNNDFALVRYNADGAPSIQPLIQTAR